MHIVQGTPSEADLPAINAVVEAAMMTWDLPERVKRLALPSYRYSGADRRQFGFALARDPVDDTIIGVAAWEPADRNDCPPGRTGMLLHGLYVDPRQTRRGLGRRLVQSALAASTEQRLDGLLVKAQRDARGFFERLGFQQLEPVDGGRNYGLRNWYPCRAE
jgi:GNAT superfamily N-acetyltransferase